MQLLLTACLASRAGTARVRILGPLDDRSPSHVGLQIPLAALRQRIHDLDPHRLAVYQGGRTPIPHDLVDTDGDARPDHLKVKIEPRTDRWLLVVSPVAGQRAELSDLPVAPGWQIESQSWR